MKVYSPLDLQRMELTNVLIHPNASAPAAPVDGQLWYDLPNHLLKYWNGTAWSTWYLTTTRLDQILAPAASVSMNNQFLINLKDPVNPQDGATKAYVDAQSQGLDTKNSVRNRLTTPPGTWSGTQWQNVVGALDGNTTYGVGDRFLVDLGTASSGIFVWAPGDIMNRATDFDAWTEIPGAFTFVEQGTSDNNGYVCTNNPGGTLNTTPVTFTQFSGAGSYTGGNGLSLTGTDFSVNVDNVGIEIVTDILRIKDGGITSAKIADGTITAGDLAPGVIPAPPTTLPPNGPAGGDLTGTYPNPTIGPSKVTSAHIANGTVDIVDLNPGLIESGVSGGTAGTMNPALRRLGATADDAAAGNHTHAAIPSPPTAHATTHQPGGSDAMAVDAAAATGSLRTLGNGAQQAAPGNHTHSGLGRIYSIGSPALTPNTWSANIGHNLNTPALTVDLYETASGESAMLDWKINGVNAIQLRSGMAVAANAFTVTVVG